MVQSLLLTFVIVTHVAFAVEERVNNQDGEKTSVTSLLSTDHGMKVMGVEKTAIVVAGIGKKTVKPSDIPLEYDQIQGIPLTDQALMAAGNEGDSLHARSLAACNVAAGYSSCYNLNTKSYTCIPSGSTCCGNGAYCPGTDECYANTCISQSQAYSYCPPLRLFYSQRYEECYTYVPQFPYYTPVGSGCMTIGATCCGNGLQCAKGWNCQPYPYCCPNNYIYCPDNAKGYGGCMPDGQTCCYDGFYCPAGYNCYGTYCCPVGSTTNCISPIVIQSLNPATAPVKSFAPITKFPTLKPILPSVAPSVLPSSSPLSPSSVPTSMPITVKPTPAPLQPTVEPTKMPLTLKPTPLPTAEPTTLLPSLLPSRMPVTLKPSSQPTVEPSTFLPTHKPAFPSIVPSNYPISPKPSVEPSISPSNVPTIAPTFNPTVTPTIDPSMKPSISPTAVPSQIPSVEPTAVPSVQPSMDPSKGPSVEPSMQPSDSPSITPTILPSTAPTYCPSTDPSVEPTVEPSTGPTSLPSIHPSLVPTMEPSLSPTIAPTLSKSPIAASSSSSAFGTTAMIGVGVAGLIVLCCVAAMIYYCCVYKPNKENMTMMEKWIANADQRSDINMFLNPQEKNGSGAGSGARPPSTFFTNDQFPRKSYDPPSQETQNPLALAQRSQQALKEEL